MKNTIFPILAFEPDNSEYIDNGTGFMVNDNGYIISAGHVVNNDYWKYFASIQNKLYPIEKIYSEYIPQEQQTEPYYKDLFIGKIDLNFTKDEIIKFSDEIHIEDNLTACGYSNRNLAPDLNVVGTLDDFLFDDCFENDEKEEEIRLPNYYELDYQCEGLYIYRAFHGEVRYFKNGLTVDMQEQEPAGLSGGPILIGEMVAGIIIARDNCISGQYIKQKLEELGIVYY